MIKTFLAALVLPPLGPLLLAAVGGLLALNRRRGGLALIALALVTLALLSCHGTAVWLARHALPQFEPARASQLAAARVQAIVILGGGVLPDAPEYGEPQLRAETAARLRYGLRLARQTGLPIAFSAGIGWAASASQTQSEAAVAERVARTEHGVALRWVEGDSRDTGENATRLAMLLQPGQVERIALVTHSWHMPRAVAAFRQAGLTVTPAPMGFVLPAEHALLEWLPSAQGLLASRTVLREVLGLLVARIVRRMA